MEFHSYLEIFKRHYKVLIITTLLVFLAGVVFIFAKPPTYEGSITVSVNKNMSDTEINQYWSDNFFSTQYADTVCNAIVNWTKNLDFIVSVYNQAGISTSGQNIDGKIKAQKQVGNLVFISIDDSNKDQAQKLISGVPVVLKGLIDSAYKESKFLTLTYGSPAVTQQGTNRNLILIISFAAGALLGLLLLFIFEYFSKTINSEEELKKLNLPILDVINIKVDSILSENSEAFNYFREVRIALQNITDKKSLFLLGNFDNKTNYILSANLAQSFAVIGKTILADADFSNPKLNETFGEMSSKGMAEVINNPQDFDKFLQETNKENLKFISAGQKLAFPSDSLAKSDLAAVKEKFFENADYAIINSPNFGTDLDLVSWAKISDVVILTVKLGKTKKETLKKALNLLKNKKNYLLVLK